jgi:hypothetical protein
MQDISHIRCLSVRKHDKFDVRDGLVVVQFVLSGTIAYETRRSKTSDVIPFYNIINRPIIAYLSSCPPSLRTIFRSENMVPKMSFASSWALSRAGRALAGPKSGCIPALAKLISEVGCAFFVAPADDGGLSCDAHNLL